MLFTLHPVHAYQEYSDPEWTLEQAAQHFGVTQVDVARVRQILQPSKSDRGELGHWRPNYKIRFNNAQRYLARVRQGQEPLTLNGIEKALRLPTYNPENE